MNPIPQLIKLFFTGLWVNNCETCMYIVIEQLGKWILGDGSQVSPCWQRRSHISQEGRLE